MVLKNLISKAIAYYTTTSFPIVRPIKGKEVDINMIMAKYLALMFFVLNITNSAKIAYAQEYVPNQLLVMTKGSESESRLQEMNDSCGTKIKRALMAMSPGQLYLLQITDGRSVEDAIYCWQQFPEVEYAEPNYIIKPLDK